MRKFLVGLFQLCGDENVGPRRQFFFDWDISETEHADATAYVIYIILAIVFFIFLFVARSAYMKWKKLQALREERETRNQQQDGNQPATNANDNEAMQQE